jgi:cytochrome c peroxidase
VRAGSLVAALLLASACEAGPEGFTEQDLALLRDMALVEPPTDPSNEYAKNREVALLGQALFFDRDLGQVRLDGTRGACADCHAPEHWFSDPRTPNHVSLGTGWTTRNSPSLVNVGYYKVFGWAGGSDSLWAQCHHAYTNSRTMAGTPVRLARALATRYPGLYVAAFGEPVPDFSSSRYDAVTLDPQAAATLDTVYRRALKAWGTYLLRLVSQRAPFDRFVLGQADALTPAQQRGLQLFLGKAGCITCHAGPAFSDNAFHALGLAQTGANVPTADLGRVDGLRALENLPYRLKPVPALSASDRGAFRTKSLRQVSETGPWFHAGQATSLVEVVWFYAQGGDRAGEGEVSPLLVPLLLSEAEQSDLVAFLTSLTGEPVPATWRCDSSATRFEPGGVAAPCGGM